MADRAALREAESLFERATRLCQATGAEVAAMEAASEAATEGLTETGVIGRRNGERLSELSLHLEENSALLQATQAALAGLAVSGQLAWQEAILPALGNEPALVASEALAARSGHPAPPELPRFQPLTRAELSGVALDQRFAATPWWDLLAESYAAFSERYEAALALLEEAERAAEESARNEDAPRRERDELPPARRDTARG